MITTVVRSSWRERLDATLPVFGHRNWIVIADSAYPSHCAPGIETIAAEEGHLDVLQTTLQRVDACVHIVPHCYTDAELGTIPDEDAPGISAYRQGLLGLLARRAQTTLAHDQLLLKVDEAARRFHVLIIKTSMLLPYSSVFLELGCRYWTDEAERKLRTSLIASSGREEQRSTKRTGRRNPCLAEDRLSLYWREVLPL
jgi:hypothetical protein